MGPLGLRDDELSTCVSCGLCLPHCPTFRVTGEELLSPRGRIAVMRAVEREGAAITPDFLESIETCVQCRGCEPACPSGVPFGHLMEDTRAALANDHRITPWWQRVAFGVLPRHRLLLAGSTVLAVAQRLHIVPRRAGLPRLALRRGSPVASTATTGEPDAWLFTGCVMDAWLRDTHRSTAKVLDAMGVGYSVPRSGGRCCGALHSHAGLAEDARKLARRVMESMPGESPILVNSAGCGASMKDYGHLLDTEEARRFAARVFDIHEYVAEHLDRLPTLRRRPDPVIVQDPCHLRHVQREHMHVRTVLGAVAAVVELDDDGLCCGAGGAYSALEPELAGKIRVRKLRGIDLAIERTGAGVVASANPGCAMHLAAAGNLVVRHPMDLLAESL